MPKTLRKNNLIAPHDSQRQPGNSQLSPRLLDPSLDLGQRRGVARDGGRPVLSKRSNGKRNNE